MSEQRRKVHFDRNGIELAVKALRYYAEREEEPGKDTPAKALAVILNSINESYIEVYGQ